MGDRERLCCIVEDVSATCLPDLEICAGHRVIEQDQQVET